VGARVGLRSPPNDPPQWSTLPDPHLPVGGRLHLYWKVWEANGADDYVVRILRYGFRLPFHTVPPVTRVPSINSQYAEPRKNCLLREAVSDMLTKSSIERVVDTSSRGFYSRLFLVPKKTGDHRPVIDLSTLNQFLTCPTFQMDTAESVRAALQPGMWATSIDLKDAYFHIPIHPAYRKYLRFQVLGEVYQFRALPFGLNVAPRLFTTIAKQVQKMGSKYVLQYIDDWLNKGWSQGEVAQSTSHLLRLCRELGWVVNLEKSDLIPRQRFEFLSYRFDLTEGLVFPTEKRILSLRKEIDPLLADPKSSPRGLMRVLGLLEATARLVPLGRLHMRPIQQLLASVWKWGHPLDAPVRLPSDSLCHLRWWTIRLNLLEGVPLHPLTPSLVVYTDASLEGWGAHCGMDTAQGKWTAEESLLNINTLELKAVFLALRAFSQTLTGHVVQVATDNTTVVAYINKQGGTKSWDLCALLWLIMVYCRQRTISLSARHIPGCINVLADQLSRRGQALHTEWSLHQDIFKQLCRMHGSPLIDLFATRFNHRLPLFVSPVPDPKAVQVDAMSMDWSNQYLYAYPPTGLLQLVLNKLAHSDHCCLLLSSSYHVGGISSSNRSSTTFTKVCRP